MKTYGEFGDDWGKGGGCCQKALMKFWEGSLDLGELGLCFYVSLFYYFPFQVETSCLREGSRAFFRMSHSEGSDIDPKT